MKVKKYAKHVCEVLNPYMLGHLRGMPEFIYEASTHILKAGGKRLRPTILILTCRLVGGSEEKALPAAAAVELLHNFTLVHDDIMDRDEFRRGVPTVHKIWGEAYAILAGDLLFSKSFEVMLELVNRGVPKDKVVEAVKYLAWAATTVAEGQALDMSFEERENVSEEEYLTMIEKKTASLFEASARIGVAIGGGDVESVKNIGAYGRYLGIAFQIQDDILGIKADEKVLGKPVGSDIREGKKTILVIYALKNISNDKKHELLNILGKKDASKEEIDKAIKIIEESGALEHAVKLKEEYAIKALNALNSVHRVDEEAYEMLKEIVDWVINRTF